MPALAPSNGWLLLPLLCALCCAAWVVLKSRCWAPKLAQASRRACLRGCLPAIAVSALLGVLEPPLVQSSVLVAAILLAPWPFLRVLVRGLEAQQQLELAKWQRDGLTGLLTRKALLQQVMALPRAAGGGVILLDVDHFKRINDRHLHSGGDRALAHVARRLASQLRIGDLLGRIGGEEFCVLLPGRGLPATAELAERLLTDARRQKVRMPDGSESPYTLSAGLATCLEWPHDAAGWEALLQQADAALYAAKDEGRDRVARHAPGRKCQDRTDLGDVRAALGA